MDSDEEDLAALANRVMALEACLVYVRNFLPEPLKRHAEETLWPDQTQSHSTG
jgi:hypothetical protein